MRRTPGEKRPGWSRQGPRRQEACLLAAGRSCAKESSKGSSTSRPRTALRYHFNRTCVARRDDYMHTRHARGGVYSPTIVMPRSSSLPSVT